MRFIQPYPYAITPQQNAESIRGIVDGLYDGQHDVNLNSATIGSAYISNLVVTTGTAGGWYANLLRASSLRILETPKDTASTVWVTPEKYLQIATGLWCPLISATL